MIQLVSELDNIGMIFKKAGLRFDDEQMKDIMRSLDRVPLTQIRWTIVKVNEINEVQEDEELEEGGEAQFMITLRRTNKSNS